MKYIDKQQVFAIDANGRIRDVVSGRVSLEEARRLLEAHPYIRRHRTDAGWTISWGMSTPI